jgi:hypothetical protein
MNVVALVWVVAALAGSVSAAPTSPRPALAMAEDSPTGRTALVAGAALARSRYLEGDFAGAIAAAIDVDRAFIGPVVVGCLNDDCPRTGPAFLDDAFAFDAWADAMTTRALALQRTQDLAGMDETFRAVIAARPAWQPDRGFVPPKQLQRFEELRQQLLLSTPMVPLQVVIDGAGELRVDGRVVSHEAPIDVVPGLHFVGVAGRGRTVRVFAPTTITVQGAPSSTSSLTPSSPESASADDRPWGLIIGGAALVVVGVVVGAVVVAGLAQPEPVSNPGGVTVLVDASRLNQGAP